MQERAIKNAITNFREALQRDFKEELFGVPPVPDKQGVLRGGVSPNMTKISKLYKH